MSKNKETRRVNKDIIALAEDPLPDMTPDDVRIWYTQHRDEDGV